MSLTLGTPAPIWLLQQPSTQYVAATSTLSGTVEVARISLGVSPPLAFSIVQRNLVTGGFDVLGSCTTSDMSTYTSISVNLSAIAGAINKQYELYVTYSVSIALPIPFMRFYADPATALGASMSTLGWSTSITSAGAVLRNSKDVNLLRAGTISTSSSDAIWFMPGYSVLVAPDAGDLYLPVSSSIATIKEDSVDSTHYKIYTSVVRAAVLPSITYLLVALRNTAADATFTFLPYNTDPLLYTNPAKFVPQQSLAILVSGVDASYAQATSLTSGQWVYAFSNGTDGSNNTSSAVPVAFITVTGSVSAVSDVIMTLAESDSDGLEALELTPWDGGFRMLRLASGVPVSRTAKSTTVIIQVTDTSGVVQNFTLIVKYAQSLPDYMDSVNEADLWTFPSADLYAGQHMVPIGIPDTQLAYIGVEMPFSQAHDSDVGVPESAYTSEDDITVSYSSVPPRLIIAAHGGVTGMSDTIQRFLVTMKDFHDIWHGPTTFTYDLSSESTPVGVFQTELVPHTNPLSTTATVDGTDYWSVLWHVDDAGEVNTSTDLLGTSEQFVFDVVVTGTSLGGSSFSATNNSALFADTDLTSLLSLTSPSAGTKAASGSGGITVGIKAVTAASTYLPVTRNASFDAYIVFTPKTLVARRVHVAVEYKSNSDVDWVALTSVLTLNAEDVGDGGTDLDTTSLSRIIPHLRVTWGGASDDSSDFYGAVVIGTALTSSPPSLTFVGDEGAVSGTDHLYVDTGDGILTAMNIRDGDVAVVADGVPNEAGYAFYIMCPARVYGWDLTSAYFKFIAEWRAMVSDLTVTYEEQQSWPGHLAFSLSTGDVSGLWMDGYATGWQVALYNGSTLLATKTSDNGTFGDLRTFLDDSIPDFVVTNMTAYEAAHGSPSASSSQLTSLTVTVFNKQNPQETHVTSDPCVLDVPSEASRQLHITENAAVWPYDREVYTYGGPDDRTVHVAYPLVDGVEYDDESVMVFTAATSTDVSVTVV